jgi:hypothetical protein
MRKRMIVDIDKSMQIAIKLQAVKTNRTTGEVVTEAIEKAFPEDIREARICSSNSQSETSRSTKN